MTKTEIIKLFVAVIIFAVVIAVVAVLGRIDTAQTIQLIITFVLVLVTVAYVKRTAEIASATREQADASMEMAEEMKEQRYGTVRPVIDIKPMEPQSMPLNIEEIANKESEEAEYLSGLHCTLHNVGIGPAIDVYSFTLTVVGDRIQKDFGILTTKGETTPDILLSPERRDEQWFLIAYYRDVYDRCFESSREIELDKERNMWSIGRLKSQIVEKG